MKSSTASVSDGTLTFSVLSSFYSTILSRKIHFRVVNGKSIHLTQLYFSGVTFYYSSQFIFFMCLLCLFLFSRWCSHFCTLDRNCGVPCRLRINVDAANNPIFSACRHKWMRQNFNLSQHDDKEKTKSRTKFSPFSTWYGVRPNERAYTRLPNWCHVSDSLHL